MRLSNAVNATLSGDGSTLEATGTITDDDVAPTIVRLSVSPEMVDEDAGATTVTVTATIDGSTTLNESTTVTVSVGDGTATSPADYGAVNDFTVTIPAGQPSGMGTFTLTPVDDSFAERNETVFVTGSTLSLVVNITSLTIRDDDTKPPETQRASSSVALAVSPSSVDEDDSATTVTVTATIDGSTTLPAATTVTVSVGDVGDSATEGTDYGTVSDITVTIAAGQRSGTGTFTMTPTNDSFLEGDETVSVNGSASGLSVVPSTLTIVDDDSSPDRTALIAFYDATGGENWTTKTNWKDESNPSAPGMASRFHKIGLPDSSSPITI